MSPDSAYGLLRQRALSLMQENISGQSDNPLAQQEVDELFHELNVLQIELELQNQELLESQVKLMESLSRQKSLQQSYQALYDDAPVCYLVVDEQANIVRANQHFYELLKLDEASVVSRPLSRFLHEADHSVFAVRFRTFFSQPTDKSLYLHLQGSGDGIPVQVTGKRFVDLDTGKYLLRVVLVDLSEKERLEADLRLVSRVFDVSMQGVMVTNAEGKIVRVNPAFQTITGYSSEEVIGQSPSILSSGHHDDEFYGAMWHAINQTGRWTGEIRNQRKDGVFFDEKLTITTLKDKSGNISHYIGTFHDITIEKETVRIIEHLAQYDQLTNLPNRYLLEDRLHQALKAAHRHNKAVAVMFLDLDHFKSLNDTYGHLAGDQLLRQIAQRLTNNLRETDTIARFGGDEFIIVVDEFKVDVDIRKYVHDLAHKLLTALSEPFHLDEIDFETTFSMGISLYPDHGETADELIQNADTAMYEVKSRGRNNIGFFDSSLKSHIQQQSVLEQSLRTALRNDELVLMYQPQFELNSRKLIGMEALIRWQHPEKGLIAPYEFLDIAEKIGLMEQIDHWVVQRACSDIQSWQATGLSVVPVSINQSHHQFGLHAHLDEWIALHLKKHNLSSSLLKVEVTETALMQNLSEAIDVLSRLAQLGIGIALDDFGTGYSSLAYLRRLPIQLLKIDRAFVQNVPEDKDDAIIVRSIIAMTKEMELQILAEGIETEAQLQFLTETGCVLGQGYLYSKPIDEVAMKQLMTSAAEV